MKKATLYKPQRGRPWADPLGQRNHGPMTSEKESQLESLMERAAIKWVDSLDWQKSAVETCVEARERGEHVSAEMMARVVASGED